MTKLSEKELNQLQKFQESQNQIIFGLGQLNIQKLELEEQYKNIVYSQNELAKKLEEKYGEGQINTTTGEFVPTVEKKEDTPINS
jgi:hypothetical protein